jgi:arsenate reductase (thioredoxin)
MKNVLLLCNDNSCLSQIAHGYLANITNENEVTIYSAGIENDWINLHTMAIMLDDGVDIHDYESNNVNDYLHLHFNYILTLCDTANALCPNFEDNPVRLHHNFPNPTTATGTDLEIMLKFKNTRELIKNYVQKFANRNLNN